VILAVYVDDILMTGSDSIALAEIKEYPKRHFVMNEMGEPKYYLGLKLPSKT